MITKQDQKKYKTFELNFTKARMGGYEHVDNFWDSKLLIKLFSFVNSEEETMVYKWKMSADQLLKTVKKGLD